MNYRVVIHPDLASTCRKVRAKDPARYEHLKKKIRLLVGNPEMGKPLHPPFKGCGGFTSGILFWCTKLMPGSMRLFC